MECFHVNGHGPWEYMKALANSASVSCILAQWMCPYPLKLLFWNQEATLFRAGLCEHCRNIPSLMAPTRLLKTHVLCRDTVITCKASLEPTCPSLQRSFLMVINTTISFACCCNKAQIWEQTGCFPLLITELKAQPIWILWWSLASFKIFSAVAIQYNSSE